MFLFRVLETSELLSDWITKGRLERDVAELATKAAAIAFCKANISDNPREHISRVISHLELVDSSLHTAVTRNKAVRRITHPVTHMADIFELFKVRLMQASCHAYLGQKPEAYKCIDLAEQCYEYAEAQPDEVAACIIGSPIQAITMWKDLALDRRVRDEDMPAWDFKERMKPRADALREVVRKQFGDESWHEFLVRRKRELGGNASWITLKNLLSVTISAAVMYQPPDNSGRWIIRGWFNVDPARNCLLDIVTTNRCVYLYYEGTNIAMAESRRGYISALVKKGWSFDYEYKPGVTAGEDEKIVSMSSHTAAGPGNCTIEISYATC